MEASQASSGPIDGQPSRARRKRERAAKNPEPSHRGAPNRVRQQTMMLKLLLLTTAWAQMTINRVPIGNAQRRSGAGSLVLEVQGVGNMTVPPNEDPATAVERFAAAHPACRVVLYRFEPKRGRK